MADRVPGYQTGSKFIDDGANHRVEIGDFVMQFEGAPTVRLEGDLVSRYHVAVVGQIWPPRCQCPDELHACHFAQRFTQFVRRADDGIVDHLQCYTPSSNSCLSAGLEHA